MSAFSEVSSVLILEDDLDDDLLLTDFSDFMLIWAERTPGFTLGVQSSSSSLSKVAFCYLDEVAMWSDECE